MFIIVIPQIIVFHIFRIVFKIFYISENLLKNIFKFCSQIFFGHIIFLPNVEHDICRFGFPYYVVDFVFSYIFYEILELVWV